MTHRGRPERVELDLRVVIRRVVVHVTPSPGVGAATSAEETGSLVLAAQRAARRGRRSS